MRTHQLHEDISQGYRDVLVLVRITRAYTTCQFDLFINPWHLFVSHRMTLTSNYAFEATIHEQPSTRASSSSLIAKSWGELTNSTNDQIQPDQDEDSIQPDFDFSNTNAPSNVSSVHPPHQARRLHAGSLDIIGFSTYSYRPLGDESIRLLILRPGETTDALQGLIIEVPFETSNPYRAISYVWGTEKRNRSLTTPDGLIGLTASLCTALRCLRHRQHAVTVWADAICINQEDLEEKAQQIHLLPEIFQKASCTFAFVGDDDRSSSAIVTLMQIRAKDLYGIDSQDWPEHLPRIPSSWNERLMPSREEETWTAIGEFFDRPWFRRVWIIQEAVAAQTLQVVCGKWVINWNDLLGATEAIDHEFRIANDELPSLEQKWEAFLTLAKHREWEARSTRWCLFSLLEVFRYAQSTLKRDHFFALLGFASDGNEENFDPDYGSPLETIVRKIAYALVRQGRGMQLLYRAGSSSQPDRFPSWIPDWTVIRQGSLHQSSVQGALYRASGDLIERIEYIAEDDVLAVDGYLVDEVTHVSKASNTPQEWPEYFKEVDAMIHNHWKPSSSTEETGEDLKWKVPIADVSYPEVAATGDMDLHSSYEAFHKDLYPLRMGERLTEESSLLPEVVERTKSFASSSPYKNAFRKVMSKVRNKKASAASAAERQDTELVQRTSASASLAAAPTGVATVTMGTGDVAHDAASFSSPQQTAAAAGEPENDADDNSSIESDNEPTSTLDNLKRQTDPPALPETKKQSLNYIAALQEKLSAWRFIATRRGHVGVVPNNVQNGDLVVVFSGGSVPFLIRRSQQREPRSGITTSPPPRSGWSTTESQKKEEDPASKKNKKRKEKKMVHWGDDGDVNTYWDEVVRDVYRLVGECYVHEIMKGEALEFQDTRRERIFLR